MKIPQANTERLDDRLSQMYRKLGPRSVYNWEGHNFIQRNGELKGACPFHESKSKRSFTVNIETGEWNCFGCSVGGGPIQYRWRLGGGDGTPEGDDFRAVADELFDQADIDPLGTGKHDSDIRRRRTALESLYRICTRHLPDDGRQYLHDRGLDDPAIDKFQLGFYPSFDIVAHELASAGFDREFVKRAGLLTPSLVHYLTIPYGADSYGRPLTLYGAWPGDRNADRPHKMALRNPTDKDDHEWLRTKESPFLLDRVLQAKHRDVILVEGVFDALVAHAHGDDRVIAVVAASPSYDQAKRMCKRRVSTVTIMLDPDAAGDKGIESSVRILSAEKIVPLVAPRLPEGKDPDEFILANGIDAWRNHVNQTTPGWVYLAQQITVDPIAPQSVRLAAFDRLLRDVPPDPVMRHEVAVVVAKATDYPVEVIIERFGALNTATAARTKTTTSVVATSEAARSTAATSAAATFVNTTYQRPQSMVPLPINALPSVVRDFLRYVSTVCSCDPAAPFMHFIAAAAGLVGNTHRVQLAPEFVEPCVLWTLPIGRSGVGKTPPYKAVMALLKPIEDDLFHRNEAADETFVIVKQRYQLELKTWQKNPKGDPPRAPEKPPVLTAFTTDATIEAIAWMHQQNWRGFLFTRSELSGWVESFGAYSGARGRDLAQWLELHDGDKLKVDRKGIDPDTGKRSIYIPSTSVSITGTIQPKVLCEVFDARTHDSGLVARLLLVYPKWGFVERDGKHDDPSSYEDRYRQRAQDLFRALHGLEPSQDKHGRPCSKIVTLDDAAAQIWWPFYNDTRRESFALADSEQEYLANAWPKLIGASARIALLLYLIRKVTNEDQADRIGADIIRAAVTIAEWLKGECERVFDLLERPANHREIDSIVELAEAMEGTLKPRNLMIKNRKKYATAEAAGVAIQRVVDAGLGDWQTVAPGPKGGRPSRHLRLRI